MPEPDDGVTHRPLPSVQIPLLRDDVRANRARRLTAAGLVLLAAVAAVAAMFFAPGLWSEESSEPQSEENALAPGADPPPLSELADAGPPQPPERNDPPAENEAAAPAALEDGSQRTVHRFGSAPGFRPALTNAGLSGAEADAVTTALDGVMDFRRCRPRHELVLIREADGTLEAFEYHASSTQIYRAERDDEGVLQGRTVEVPIERIRVQRGGTVRTSLGSALENAGLGRSLVGTFVETFERHVNFNTHTRAGDTFRIIVDEERVAGELLRYGRVHALEVRGERLGEHQAFFYEPREGLDDFYDASGRAVHGGWLRTPLRYDHISSPFDPNRMHPILRRVQPHNGVDYAAGTGTPVWAAADGVISFIGPRGANGNLVSLRHENGYETHYAHLHRFASGLSRGDRVRQRQVIGYVGSTGRSTGPHLHFGLKRNGRFIDPQAELNGPGRMMPPAYLGRFRRTVRRLQSELSDIPVEPRDSAPRDEAAEPEASPEPTD